MQRDPGHCPLHAAGISIGIALGRDGAEHPMGTCRRMPVGSVPSFPCLFHTLPAPVCVPISHPLCLPASAGIWHWCFQKLKSPSWAQMSPSCSVYFSALHIAAEGKIQTVSLLVSTRAELL